VERLEKFAEQILEVYDRTRGYEYPQDFVWAASPIIAALDKEQLAQLGELMREKGWSHIWDLALHGY